MTYDNNYITYDVNLCLCICMCVSTLLTGSSKKRPSMADGDDFGFGGEDDDVYTSSFAVAGRDWLRGVAGLHTAVTKCTPALLSQLRKALRQVRGRRKSLVMYCMCSSGSRCVCSSGVGVLIVGELV